LKLFEEIKLGGKILNNRMVMSAMTRSRTNKEGIVGDITAEYYAQRASAGMMLTEGINISKMHWVAL
jgi:N-ethylmaleimide reductase